MVHSHLPFLAGQWAGHHLKAAVKQHRAVMKLRDEDVLRKTLRTFTSPSKIHRMCRRFPRLTNDSGFLD